ncbi:MAG: transketolase family protein [Clostridia bacterium]|nr:transketolase family protein [Clostridia bacterium]
MFELGQKIATREAYGKTLVELGAEKDFVVLDADLAEATKTCYFAKAYPNRFFDCGIAEGNMVGIAAGLAAAGKTVVASSFAMFAAGRAFEQIRNSVAYPHLNVKICATHAGITVGEDGATHQCLEDLAIMRVIPGMTVINPSDAVEAAGAMKAALETDGPFYIRFGRYAVPVVHDEAAYTFKIGKGEVIAEGANGAADVTVINSGMFLPNAKEAAEILAAKGVSVRIINMPTVKPLDTELVAKAAAETGAIVTVEEHNVIGGLGSAVAECVCESCPVPVVRMGVNDTFGRSGKVPPLLEAYGLTTEVLVQKIEQALALKK